jgi:nucleotide-binding universal stress UspA family protein
MKQILVAFDFSKNAIKTLEYALMVANKTGADLSLVWVDSTSTPDNMLNIDHELRIETKKLFEEILPLYEPKLNKGKIDVILRKGKVYTEITNTAKMLEADIVFAGTHGVSGFEQFWIGSNAYRIVTNSPCPVMTIRGDFDLKGGISKILIPLDSTSETRQKLPFATMLAGLFKAEIHLLLLYNTSIRVIRNRMKTYADEAMNYLKSNDISYVFKEIEAENIVSNILQYANDEDVDLISIMTEQGSTSGGMFLGPYAQQIINNSLVPVLSLQSKRND